MQTPFRAFMSGLIDYAGLFPPARLELDAAIRSYARYLAEDDAWMLNRFIIPATRLDELDPYVAELFAGEAGPLRLTVIAGAGAHPAGAMRAFAERHGGRVAIEAVETPLSPEAESAEQVAASLRAMAGFEELELYVEVPGGRIADVAGIAGFKLRCGGLEAAAFPSIEQVADVIAACRDQGVPLKCTAGLHHPMRHPDPDTGAVQHGFFNLFGAGVLAHALQLSTEQIRSCLAEENASAFTFDDDAFAWNGFAADASSVAAARSELMTGYGSCSFDEPREDLRSLGLLT
jgi:hypothetical protein